ncbi:MAG: hypothetical protein P8J67_03580 [Flavobacteriaceae bacterium]|nr:hypothetical protein [Flavobacteriaceae bacterium]
MKKRFLLGLIMLGLISSCNNEKEPSKRIFFGGQIINPSSRTVTLYQGNNPVEIFKLDRKLRFQNTYDSLYNGIYKLEHLPEYQSLLLEKGDSLWVRINAATFNESIVYSGSGASKNNFLMELLLRQEKENDYLSSKYSRNRKNFSQLLDSMLLEKKNLWIGMDSLNKLSPIAQKVTQAAYIYPYATIRERYALLRGSQWTAEEDSIYFDFRKYLNYGDNDLAFFDPYVNYVLNYINQMALEPGSSYFKIKQTTDFNMKRLEVLDENIEGSLLRNNLARAIAFEEILNFENHGQHESFLKFYSTINNSPLYLSEVLDLHSDISSLEPKNLLPKILLQNSKRDTISSASLAKDKTTVIYFWSQTQMNHYRNSLERVNRFQKNYPSIRFVGICIQPFNSMVDEIQNIMEVDKKNQFALVDFETARKAWVLTLLNKSIIIDSKGKILEGFGNFSDTNFESSFKK